MTKQPIPVIIVAGFLGSGKTTLLNHLLHNNAGARIGVVVNDFGSVNIDAMLVAGQVDSTLSLSNGCLCCAVDARGFDAMLARLSRPAARLDLIVVEASGLAEPRELIRLMLASENPAIAYGGLVEVVDGAEFESTRTRHPELDQHLKVADLIVLNKIDRAEDPSGLGRTLTELSAGVPVVPATHGRIDPRMLFDPVRSSADEVMRPRQLSFDDLRHEGHEGRGHCDDHLHAAYESIEFSSAEPLHPRRFLDFLNDRPAGLYRLKGFVHFGVPGHDQKFTLQAVGGFVQFARSRWSSGEARRTQLVLIGARIDAAELRLRLDSCLAPDPDALDERALLPILGYFDP